MRDDPAALVARGYDRLARRYQAWASATADDAREHMTTALERRLAAGAEVVDLGCGTGLPSTARLAQRYHVTGVDGSAAQLELAAANVPGATFVHADMSAIDLPRDSIDAVTAFYAISHLPRATHAKLFGRVARWLRPGGLFLATLGARDTPDWSGEWLGEQMFFSSFDADGNRRLVEEAGFEIVLAEVLPTPEPDGTVDFLWVLARRVAA